MSDNKSGDASVGNSVLDAVGNVISAVGGGIEGIGIYAKDSRSERAGKIIGKFADIVGITAKANDEDGFTYNDAVATIEGIIGGNIGGGALAVLPQPLGRLRHLWLSA